MTRRPAPASWHPAAVLLAVQILGVVIFPFIDEARGRAVLALFGLVVLFLAVRAVQASPALTWISIVLGVPIAILSIAQIADPTNQQLDLSSSVLFAIFYFYTSYALIRYLYEERVVTAETLLATGATFTVVAWAFAYSYEVVQVIWPGSFSAPIGGVAGEPRTWFELLFLSFTNLTSVGLSDITPVLPNARSVVMIEQVAGLLYVALIISRIVGITVTRQRADAGRE
jgi:Ion channel